MTHDEIFIHLGTLSAMDGWLWIYAQTPAIQTMALRNMVALGAETSGMKPDAAWSYALRAVPEDDGQPWFTGVDPDGEWIAALDAFNEVDDGDEDADADAWDAWVDDLSEDPAAFQEVGNGYWSQSDTATTLCTGPGAGMRNLVTHEGRVGSGRVGSGRVGKRVAVRLARSRRQSDRTPQCQPDADQASRVRRPQRSSRCPFTGDRERGRPGGQRGISIPAARALASRELTLAGSQPVTAAISFGVRPSIAI
jgi:hypothetical protein